MDKRALSQYLKTHIPITNALGIEVVEGSEESVILQAPLAPNINHRDSAFGGSISSILITACWSYLRILFDDEPEIPTIVVSRSGTDFLNPIRETLVAEVIIPEKSDLNHLLDMYQRFGKGRITLRAAIQSNGDLGAYFEGDFVVIKPNNPDL